MGGLKKQKQKHKNNPQAKTYKEKIKTSIVTENVFWPLHWGNKEWSARITHTTKKSHKKSVRSQTFSDDHYLEIIGWKSNLEQKLHEKAKTQQSLYKVTTEEQHKQ